MLARATPGRELVETAKASEESDSCRIKANGQNPRAFQLAPPRSLGRRPWRARRFLNSRGPTLARGHADAMMSRAAVFPEKAALGGDAPSQATIGLAKRPRFCSHLAATGRDLETFQGSGRYERGTNDAFFRSGDK